MFLIYIERDFYSERKYNVLNIYREISTVDKNTRFLIYIYREISIVNENTRFLYIFREISIVNENTRFLIYI